MVERSSKLLCLHREIWKDHELHSFKAQTIKLPAKPRRAWSTSSIWVAILDGAAGRTSAPADTVEGARAFQEWDRVVRSQLTCKESGCKANSIVKLLHFASDFVAILDTIPLDNIFIIVKEHVPRSDFFFPTIFQFFFQAFLEKGKKLEISSFWVWECISSYYS